MTSEAALEQSRPTEPGRRDGRTAYACDGRTYWLSAEEARTLADVGKFRVVRGPDLAEHVYGGSVAAQEASAARLTGQGLVSVVRRREEPEVSYVALTKMGRRLVLEHQLVPEGQVVYAEVRQGRQIAHDAALYAIFRRAVVRQVPRDAKVVRVELDYELKARMGRERADLAERGFERGADQVARAAAVHGLSVVDGHVVLPDLRIVYRAVSGEVRNLDLEHVTRWSRNLADKREAGFRLFGDARAKDLARRETAPVRAWMGR